jgi:hypothetical protein
MPCLQHEKLLLVRDLPDPKSDIFGHGNPLRVIIFWADNHIKNRWLRRRSTEA